ncbi:MAG: hypothetical protein DWQ07_08755 [Chloroflexi bacterium]|nr:MAG: hypothetical protein DWQ07_08755 [Chloroflexota bacterium]MBL1193199.1 hypothetical protein [Chloroflexota bacterium]NOH10493.1 hypothetical protein [Chloroflexota bacterium]
MYWFRDTNFLALLPWLTITLVWWLGGWLLATHAFTLKRRERLLAGFGLGLLLYAWFVNILGRWLSADLAYILPAMLVVLVGGLAYYWGARGVVLDWGDLRRVWPWLLVGLALVFFFVRIGKGLAIFDEGKNLSLISIMGAGDIPPPFFDDENFPINHIYHYGFHFLGGSLMQLGGMLPWSAFDFAKAIVWTYTVLLAGLLGRRYIKKPWGALAAAFVLVFAMGTRYLLLLLPPGILQRADRVIELQGTSALMGLPFSEALTAGWTIDGGPPVQYMFGFLNGIMDPFVMSHQGPNAFAVAIFLLVWLVASHTRQRLSIFVLTVVFAMWALAWETSYGMFVLGMFAAAALVYWRAPQLRTRTFQFAFFALLLSIPVVLTQGGTLTEMLRNEIYTRQLDAATSFVEPASTPSLNAALAAEIPETSITDVEILGFSLRWPPAILSSHLGALSLFSPVQLLVALFELGPIIFFTPWIMAWVAARSRKGDWMLAALALSAWIGFLIPILFQYQADRDISRLTWQALLTWTLLLVMMLGDKKIWQRVWFRNLSLYTLALMCFGGVVLAGNQLTAASTTRLAHRYTELDAAIAAQVWDKLPQDAKIFSPFNMNQSTILTGRLTGALLDERLVTDTQTDNWNRWIEQPILSDLHAAGYDFVFVDNRWWVDLPAENQAEFQHACVDVYAEVTDNSGINFRRVLDISDC